MDKYFASFLSMQDGSRTVVNGKRLFEWLTYGAKEEDNPACRASNHFHNPYGWAPTYWADAGLSDVWWPMLPYCGVGDYATWNIRSNLTWATGCLNMECGEQSRDADSISRNAWDWPSARQYFYTYLTGMNHTGQVITLDQPSRDYYLVNTLQAIGQVMHLLQDMAVPAHVRDDFSQGHLMLLPGWDSPKKWVGNDFERYVEQHNERWWFFGTAPVKSLFSNMKLTDLWDTDQLGYGYAPPGLGLAEYASLNFMSENSSFKPKFYFPRVEHCLETRDAPPAYTESLFTRKYVSSTSSHPGDQVQHLAVVSYLKYFRDVFVDKLIPGDFIVNREQDPYYFDSNCHEDYAAKLIPRAIGYSADLLDYFFRGRFDIQSPMAHHGPGFVISGMRLEARNATLAVSGQPAPDSMENGHLDLVYHYFDPLTDTWGGGVATEIYTVTSADDPINSDFIEIDATFPQPIPFGARQVVFTLVYSGRLGHEPDAVIGARVNTDIPSRIAYEYQPGGTPNASDIHIILPDGRDDRKITESSGANYYYSPDWSPVAGSTTLAYEFETCTVCDDTDTKRIITMHDVASADEPVLFHDLVTVADPPDQFCSEDWGDLMLGPSFSSDGLRLSALNWAFPPLGAVALSESATAGGWHWINNYNFWSRIDFVLSAPAWSPSRDEIAFCVGRQPDPNNGQMITENDIYLISVDGQQYTPLTDDNDHMDAQPAWSPDGQWIAFISDRDEQGFNDLWVMDRTGNNKVKILECDPDCGHPTFSPDGMKMAFVQNDDIQVMTIFDQTPVQITHRGYRTSSPDWSPAIALPEVSLEASADNISSGQAVTLSWRSSDADSAEIDNGIGKFQANGSTMVYPTVTTTYTITVLGIGGYAEASVTINVN
ncbi:MAG: hypothetical protein M0036_26765 [Desulfobacteraceae bacterium]|nr:hypothetical protein [Desulfobacteraceae bacterium]